MVQVFEMVKFGEITKMNRIAAATMIAIDKAHEEAKIENIERGAAGRTASGKAIKPVTRRGQALSK